MTHSKGFCFHVDPSCNGMTQCLRIVIPWHYMRFKSQTDRLSSLGFYSVYIVCGYPVVMGTWYMNSGVHQEVLVVL